MQDLLMRIRLGTLTGLPLRLALCLAGSLLQLISCRERVAEKESAPTPVAATPAAPIPPPVGSAEMPPGTGANPPAAANPADSALGKASTLRITESARAGEDEIVGVLRVDSAAAYFDDGERGRIRLIEAAPMTAVGSEALMARTAEVLRGFVGQKVRARGELQATVLWGARVQRVQ
jgi:hypothetical protein